jgi:hypothetical protein
LGVHLERHLQTAAEINPRINHKAHFYISFKNFGLKFRH